MGFVFGILNGLITSFEHRNLRKTKDLDPVGINILRFVLQPLAYLSLVY